MYCVHCGVQNVDDANFCFNCGKELSCSPTEEVVESRTNEPQSEVRVHHPWMPVQQRVQAESQQIQEEAPQVHHPWMPVQQQPQEQVQEEPQEESEEQDQGEVPNALKSILRRVKGWSKKKKILAGIVLFFLFITCVGVIFGEPVESEPSTKDALIAVFEEKGYEQGETLAGTEYWRHPNNNDSLSFSEISGLKTTRLTLRVPGNSLSAKNITDMQDFISAALPAWSEGDSWIEGSAPKAFASAVDRAGFGESRRKTFTPNNAEGIVGEYGRIRAVLQRERTIGGTPLITIRLEQYD